jgi:hypothetical protein
MKELQQKRSILARRRENESKRSRFGNNVVSKFNLVFQSEFTLEDFCQNKKLKSTFANTKDLRQAKGLNASYINKTKANKIVLCCDMKMGETGGCVGFDEYGFVGLISLEGTSLSKLLELAFLLNDSVFFWPEGYEGVILLDHYDHSIKSHDQNFSIVMQDELLEKRLSSCFSEA